MEFHGGDSIGKVLIGTLAEFNKLQIYIKNILFNTKVIHLGR